MPSQATVVVIDDDAEVREALCFLLRSKGYSVKDHASCEAFLEAASDDEVGCVLADVMLPKMSGLELQQKLAADGTDTPVIVMTGHGSVPMAVEAMKAGAVDFLQKPIDGDELVASLENALERADANRRRRLSADSIRQRIDSLTPRERQVMEAVVAGHPNKVIGYRLCISPRTVEVHRARVMEKMHAASLSELVRMVLLVRSVPDAKTSAAR